MRTTEEGVQKIKAHEAFREFAYPDPASALAKACRKAGLRLRWGFSPAIDIIATLPEDVRGLSGSPWTCGYGETQGVDPTTRWSRQEAGQRLRTRIAEFEAGVLRLCQVEPNLNQLMAMTSFAYNAGLGWQGAVKPKGAKDGFRQSTVLRAHNRGDFVAAANAFKLWDKAGGVVMPGLVKRRADEAALYLRPVADDVSDAAVDMEEPVSQQVDPEKPMTQSTINRGAVVAGGSAAVATVTETARTVSDLKWSLQSLGDWLVPALLVITMLACGYLVWERVKQRKGGWA